LIPSADNSEKYRFLGSFLRYLRLMSGIIQIIIATYLIKRRIGQMDITLSSLIDISAGKYPDSEAVIFDYARVTFSQLRLRINKRANALLELGIGRETHVGVYAAHSMGLTETMLAIWRIGAVFVPLNYRHGPDELVYVIDHADVTSLIYQDEYRETLDGMKPRIPGVKNFLLLDRGEAGDFVDFEDVTDNQSDEPPGVEVSGDDLAVIMHTAGTTGQPKGVLHTQKTCASAVIAVSLTRNFPVPEGSPPGYKPKRLFSGPFFHIGGVLNFLSIFLSGGSVVIQKQFNPVECLELIEKEKINAMAGVATLYNLLLMAPGIEKYDLSSMVGLNSGAETMPAETRKRLMKIFPGAEISEAYGMTESCGIITLRTPEYTESKPHSVGLPAALMEVKVVDEMGTEVKPNEVGELIVRGANIMTGYYKDPEKTADALRDGWLWTHDLARKDEDGFLYIVERKNDMLKSGGENIYPKEIEDVLYRHEKIAEAAVFGVPDPVWGQKVYAAVVLEDGQEMTEEEVVAFAKENLASFKKPKRVIFRDSLPRSPVGKILRKNLRDEYNG